MVYVAYSYHLVVGMCIPINDDAELDANQANIMAAMNNLI